MKRPFDSKFLLLLLVFTLSLKAESRELKFLFNNFPPFQYMTKQGPDGPNIRLMKRIAKEAGHTIKFENIPWSRSLRMVRLGHVDGMISLYKTPARSRDLVYSHHPLDTNVDLLVSASKAKIPPIERHAQIKKYTVGVLSDNSYGEEFDSLVVKKDFSCTTEDHILKKLLEGRFEVAVISKKPLFHYLDKLKIKREKVQVHPIIISTEGLYYALSKKMKNAHGVMSELNQAHQRLLANTED